MGMVVTVPLRGIAGAFLWFLILGLPIALLAQLVTEWRFTLFLLLLFGFAAVLAYSLSKGFDAYYRRQPGTVQYRLHVVSDAAYRREFAVQEELGVTAARGRFEAKAAARRAVETEKQAIVDEQAQIVADDEAAKTQQAAADAAAAAQARAAAEERVADRF